MLRNIHHSQENKIMHAIMSLIVITDRVGGELTGSFDSATGRLGQCHVI